MFMLMLFKIWARTLANCTEILEIIVLGLRSCAQVVRQPPDRPPARWPPVRPPPSGAIHGRMGPWPMDFIELDTAGSPWARIH